MSEQIPQIDSSDPKFDSINVNRLGSQRRPDQERAAAIRAALVTALGVSDLAEAVRGFTLESSPGASEEAPVAESLPEAPTPAGSPEVDPPIDRNLSY